MRPKKSVVRGSSWSEAMRRASTRLSTSPEIASLALDASSCSADVRIRASSLPGVVEVGLLALEVAGRAGRARA